MKSEAVPRDLIRSLQRVPGFDEEAFARVHQHPEQVVSVRINPQKVSGPDKLFLESSPVPWCSTAYYLPERPAFIFDPALHAGAYYVQEASGTFLEQCLRQTLDHLSPLTSHPSPLTSHLSPLTSHLSPLRVLDLCAAPGGKSTLIHSLLSPGSLLVSNEVIKSRAAVLVENITKWGGGNVIVTNNDPRDFSRLPGFFDVMVVDAPCSGSGLFRRDPGAINEWSPEAVQTCSLRQQRILADAYDCLKQNGVLIYSTCSYSPEEDEQICDWLLSNYNLESLRINIDANWNIIETQSEKQKAFGYRFFPDKLRGEGFYVACFRKKDGVASEMARIKKPPFEKASAAERKIVEHWIKPGHALNFYRHEDELFAWPASPENELFHIRQALHVKKAGVTIGKVMKDELLPDHDLALSGMASEKLLTISLKKDEALQYLRKEEVTLRGSHKGWALVKYNDLHLGWVKILSNRINNYYPKEWRILKSGTP